MKVQYHGPSGEFTATWPQEFEKVPVLVHFQDRLYDYAGTQDGAHHFKEREGVSV